MRGQDCPRHEAQLPFGFAMTGSPASDSSLREAAASSAATPFRLASLLLGSRGLMAALPVCLAVLAYGNTVFHGFSYDDIYTVERNPLLRADDYWRRFFSPDYFWMSGEETFRPLVTLSYGLEHKAFGLWAGGYHLTNVALHALNAWLLFLVVAPWFSQPVWGALAASLFAVHTAGTEAVDGVSFREDVLVAAFLLTAWLALRRALRPGTRVSLVPLAAASVLYFLGCLSKESGLVFVALAALGMRAGLLAKGAEKRTPLLPGLLALNALMPAALLFLWVWGAWMGNPGKQPHAYLGGSRLAAAFNLPAVYAHHLKLLLWPAGLQADYIFPGASDILSVAMQAQMALFIVALCAVVYLFERAPRIGFGLAWIVVTLAPVSNLVPLINPLADRYLYLPLAGFAMSAAAAAEALWRRSAGWSQRSTRFVRRAVIVAAAAGLAALLYATTQRNLVWSSDERLWSETVQREPNSYRAWLRLGDALRAQAQPLTAPDALKRRYALLGAAEQYLRKARSLAPHHPDVRNALGNVYLMEGELDEAIEEYRTSLYLLPRNPTASINLAQAYTLRDPPNYDLAAFYMTQAARLGYPVDPRFRAMILDRRRASHLPAPATQ
ncbi:MAG: tetratricopeptide repeat protein, partial [Candidatus Sumerlaeota bacterium]|nr:tetratricopeptide repeat protein [Candidatus Sumerlaeota bacterium]